MAASASSISGGGTTASSTFGSTSGSDSSVLKVEGAGFAGSSLVSPLSVTMQPSHSQIKLGGQVQFASSNSALFGVFDGHGGIEVAEFCARHFEDVLRSNSHYQSKQFELALQETFLEMDTLLQSPEGKAEIVEINKLFPA